MCNPPTIGARLHDERMCVPMAPLWAATQVAAASSIFAKWAGAESTLALRGGRLACGRVQVISLARAGRVSSISKRLPKHWMMPLENANRASSGFRDGDRDDSLLLPARARPSCAPGTPGKPALISQTNARHDGQMPIPVLAQPPGHCGARQ